MSLIIKKPTAEQTALVTAAAASLNKQYDTKLVQKLKGQSKLRLPSLSLELPTFDWDTIQCGGFANGRIYEIYGPESAGKTSLCLHAIACAQRAGKIAVFVDAEHALVLKHAATLGVDTDELLISQPDYGEQAIEVVEGLAASGGVGIIVVDSVSALIPKAELEGEMTDASMGMQARLMSKAMRKLIGVASQTGTIIIFINQVREKIGVMFGNPEVTTGGRALKFFASARFEVRRLSKSEGGEIKDGDTHIGHVMRIKNVKNKVGSPFCETQINFLYGSGFDRDTDMVLFLENHGKVTDAAKGWLSFNGKNFRRNDAGELLTPMREEVAKVIATL